MTDDRRPSQREPDDFSEFGSLFDDSPPTDSVERVAADNRPTDDQPSPADDPAGTDDVQHQRTDHQRTDSWQPGSSAADDSGSISFGASDTGSLPHWTAAPSGEVPRLEAAATDDSLEDEVDVWSSFSSESPVWKDDRDAVAADDLATSQMSRISGSVPAVDPDLPTTQQDSVATDPRRSGPTPAVSAEHDLTRDEPAGEPGAATGPPRITIATDPSGVPRREPPSGRRNGRGRGAPSARRGAPVGAPRASGRDMPTAIAVGMLLAALFIGSLILSPLAVLALTIVVLAVAVVEFFGRIAEKGYRPVMVPGLIACVTAPVATYFAGETGLLLVTVLGFIVATASFAGMDSVESGPLPNSSVTVMGAVWIGVLGSFAIMILRLSTSNLSQLETSQNWGTDTLFLLALGIVANDVGALISGMFAGRTPLRHWISPNKTVEGLIGGTFFTLVVLVLVGVFDFSDTWSSTTHLVLLGLVISVMAPMGDIVESMFKRNLHIKDFGAVIRGHGGALDRFDAFLFTLPAVYYLTIVLQPWAVS